MKRRAFLSVVLAAAVAPTSGFDPVNAGSLAASKAFDLGSSVSGRVLTAPELRQALKLTP